MAPRSDDASSPICPLDRFTINILLVSSTCCNRKLLVFWPTIFLSGALVMNRPVLFRIGEIASARSVGEYLLNSLYQKERICSSPTYDRAFSRISLSVKRGCMSSRVASGIHSSVRSAKRKMYSIRGPQLSDHIFLKVETKPEATRWWYFGWMPLSGLKAIGLS